MLSPSQQLPNRPGAPPLFPIILFSAKITRLLAQFLYAAMIRRSLLWVPISMFTVVSGLADSSPPPEDRVTMARQRVIPILVQRFAAAGLSYPGTSIFFCALKLEREFELWARNVDQETYRLVHIYPILGASGRLGPKRREGDQQVPEGFYEVDWFNPKSEFHLSLRINYPNAADRKKSDPVAPGSDIYLHGGDRSTGCLAMGDDAIEEIYVAAQDATQPVPIAIFPARMSDPSWPNWANSDPDQIDFWSTLKPGYRFFSEQHRLPIVKVDESGNYLCD
jgi:murein L,D-transpeptidase YafK